MDVHHKGAGNSIAEQVEKPIMEKVQFSSGAYQDSADLYSFYYWICLCGVIRIHRVGDRFQRLKPRATALNTLNISGKSSKGPMPLQVVQFCEDQGSKAGQGPGQTNRATC